MFQSCYRTHDHNNQTATSKMTPSSWYHPLCFFHLSTTKTPTTNNPNTTDCSCLEYSNDSLITLSPSSTEGETEDDSITMAHPSSMFSSSNVNSDDSSSSSSPPSSVDTIDMIQSLCQQERKHYQKGNWLLHSSQISLLDHHDEETTKREDCIVDSTCRSIMISWCYDVMDVITSLQATKHHRMASSSISPQEIIEITLSYIDRYMSTTPADALYDTIIFQRVCMMCFYIALKIHSPVCITIRFISSLFNGLHSVNDLQVMERNILLSLSWYVNPPTSLLYINLCILLIQKEFGHMKLKDNSWFWEQVLIQSRQQITYALSDETLMTTPSYIIAYCSIMNAFELVVYHDDNNDACSCIISRKQLKDIRSRLLALIRGGVSADDNETNHLDVIHIQQRLRHHYHHSPNGSVTTVSTHEKNPTQQQQEQKLLSQQQNVTKISSSKFETYLRSTRNVNHNVKQQQQHRNSSPCSALDNPNSNHH